MDQDRFTIQIVPDGAARTRVLRVTRRTLTVAAALALTVIVSVVGWLAFLAVDAERAIDLASLRAENRELAADLRLAERRTLQLARSLDELAAREERFRLVAGLPLIDPDIRRVGVGGPGAGSPVGGASGVSANLDLLLRRADLLSASLLEAVDSVRVQRDVFLARPSILPVGGRDAWISSSYSRSRYHPILHHNRPHTGIDISARHGAPIMAAARGTVSFAGQVPGYGKLVEIDHGYGYRTRYAHAARILVRRGQDVLRGDVIAEVGDTGLSTGPNLHYEVLIDDRPVDPRPFLLNDQLFQ